MTAEQATKTQPDEPDLLAAFVPRLAVELGRKPTPSWTSVDGSMLSADISGFTALSEKLAAKGKAGAEELTALINTCFTTLIDAAYLYGGEVLKFGGDAVLVLFRGDHHERRSADAGLAMQAALLASAAAQRANLAMTVGIAAGPFDVFLVGSAHHELLITGPRATEVIRLEGEAEKGDTVVDPLIGACLPAAMKIGEHAGGFVIAGSTGDAPWGPTTREFSDLELTPFVPPAVVRQLDAFSELGGEHRIVTIGFVMIIGIAEQIAHNGPQGVAESLGVLVDEVLDACDAFGVTALHTDIAGDGLKFILCAGAPVSPGDTTDAMLHAALQIASTNSPFTVRQGVQTGRVYAGFLGSPYRRTYTLMGDPVNTAARMLGKADDRDIVAVAAAVAGTRTVFEADELEPFMVKGKSEPIVAAKVRAATAMVRRDSAGTKLVGRERELEILTRAIGELDAVVELVGQAGGGKSRLLDAAWSLAEGLTIHQGACTPYGAASPYSVFRPLMRGGAGIALDAPAEAAGVRLTEIVTQYAPGLMPMLPLLAVPFGAKVPATPEVDAIDPEFRRRRLHDVVVEFLDATLSGPMLLVVEDAHWIDDASGELTNHLVHAADGRPWAGIITRRPEGSWRAPQLDHVTTIELAPLDAAATRQLALDVSSRDFTDRELDLIVDRAQGNPLFTVELARALSDAVSGDELPGTVEQLIATRFDRLDPMARRVIRVASVLGNVFDVGVVTTMLGVLDADVDAQAALAAAEATSAIAQQSGGSWAFNHALYRDTAYEGLPFDGRRRLHRLAAQIIESRAVDAAAVAPVLSIHYSAAGAHEQAWRFSLQAAESARAQNAATEEAGAYERALAAGRYCRSADARTRAEVAERLGDVYYVIGRFHDADQTFRRSRRANTDPIADVRLMRKLGAVQERKGQPTAAIRWFTRARRAVPPAARSSAWRSARADVDLAEAGLRARQDDNERCLMLSTAALVDAERAGDDAAVALALERIHLGLIGLGRQDVDETGRRALEAHRHLGDHSAMARVLINLGVEAYFESRWSDAAEHYLEALAIAERAGSVVLAANAAINSAEVLSDQGSWAQALDLFAGAARNYAAVGYRPGEAATALFSAVAAMRLGEVQLARERYDLAGTELRRLGMELTDDLATRELELAVLTRSVSTTECDAVAALVAGDGSLAVRVARCKAVVSAADGNTGDALADLSEVLDRNQASDYERAAALSVLLRLAPDDPAAPIWSGEVKAVCAKLGVVRLSPMFPDDLTASVPVPAAQPVSSRM